VKARVEKILESGLAERALEVLLSQASLAGEPRAITAVNASADRRDRGPRLSGVPAPGRRDSDQWVPFRVTWGEAHGADPRRLVAMLCRRGDIRGSDIGAIEVSRFFSNVEVSARVAAGFARNTSEPDPRDPRVVVTPLREGRAPERSERPEGPGSRFREHKPVAREHKPVAREHKPVAREHKPVAREHKPVAREHKPVAREHKPVARDSEQRKPHAKPTGHSKGGQKPPKRRFGSKLA
jgi:ATP-dependent RNA helicase DeaD